MPISAAKKLLLKSVLLLSGQANDFYWTAAWYAYLANPADQMLYQAVWFRLASMRSCVMNMAEYQLAFPGYGVTKVSRLQGFGLQDFAGPGRATAVSSKIQFF